MKFQFDLLPPLRTLHASCSAFAHYMATSATPSAIVAFLSKPTNALNSQDKEAVLIELSTLLVTEEELTLPIARLFRPLLSEFVGRVVYEGTAMTHAGASTELFPVESVASAFSKILPLAPHLCSTILEYFARVPSLFERIERMTDVSKVPISVWIRLAQTAYRLLRFSVAEFGSTLWDWSPFFALLSLEDKTLRHYTLRCVALLLRVSDSSKWKLPLNTDKEQIKILQEQCIKEGEEEALEQMALLVGNAEKPEQTSSNTTIVEAKDLHTPLVDVCGILLSKKSNISNNTTLITSEETANANETTNHKENRLVYTPTAAQNMRALALAVCQGQPILLEGVTGAGKTALIEELATLALHHPRDLIRIHLGDQTDAKVLLGTYVCTDVPGEFRWQAGALTQAVREGRWIVIEDIDMAPLEILSVLIPLLETRQLFIPGRGEVVCAPKSFQLFATQTLLPGNASSSSQNARLLGNFWTRVIVDPLTSEELSEVLRIKYPEIASLVPQFMETYLALTRTASSNKQEPVDTPQTPKTQYLLPSVFAGRYLSTRDLLKWCKRVHRLFKHSAHENMTTLQVREAIFSEAMDCFAALIPSPKWRRQCCTILGSCWGLTPERSHHYLDMYKPSTTRSPSAFCVGRVTLPKIQLQAKIGLGEQQTRNFAHTKHSLTLLEKIAMSVYMEEPVLLVGETGTGKTSVVQYLANMLNRPLTIQNMSQQSDTADLLGGFKPVELRIVCAPLKQQFEKLFTKTFSRKANKKFINDVELSYAKKNWPRFVRLLNQAVRMAAQKLEQRQKAGTNKHPVEEQQNSNQQRSTQRKRKTRSNSNASSNASSSSTSKDGSWSPQLREEWKQFAAAISKFELQQEQVKNNFAFSFVEGSLVNAIRNGHWLLLDEINLATAETLESISSLLDGGSVCLTERGDVEPIPRHPDLRIFACMNPPTDIGKKNLVPALRNRFTEIYVDELSSAEDLRIVVSSYLSEAMTKPPIDEIVSFYLAARSAARVELADGANQKPHYSLRTLCRALEYAKLILPMGYGPKRALYEGFRMSFLTQLNEASYPLMAKLIDQHFLQGMSPKELKRPPRRPSSSATKSKNNEEDVDDYGDEGKETVTSSHVLFEQFWIAVGDQPPINPASYILTPTIRQHITNLARIVLAGKYPVLLQGPTSSGKTSMVEYLARRTGHRFVRINNHEHTDIQEYLGTYVSDPQTGKLVFREGILVEAVRKGYWVVLDELNLAPSEVLEALNRLLDDNHELFIPETQEIVRPHPHFMLFATQNPPGIYGGRKVLSRAFRNRFLELHIDDIPSEELETILNQRCQLPPSYCKKLVLVMQDLQRHRQGTRVFAGKHGFITLRDLFRWAERRPGSWQELAEEGYMLLAERLRRDEEKQVIQYCLEKHMPRVSLDLNAIYNRGFARPPQEQASSHDAPNPEEDNTSYGSVTIEELKTLEGFEHIVWTKSMRRLFTLVGRCLQHKEPVLLVGETGSGKTSICQLYAALLKQRLHILNCHQQTETADFLGGLRPVRGKEAIRTKCKALVAQCFAALAEFFASSAALLPPSNSELLEMVKGQLQKGEQPLEANQLAEQMAIVNRCASLLSHLEKKIAITNDDGSKTAIKKKDGKRKQEVIPSEKEEKEQENDEADQALLELSPSQVALLQQQLNTLRQLVQEIQALHKQHTALFQWYDGPLVQAMKQGDLFLIDEISLAEDSVLERLNSVLEPHRLLVLAEKGGGGDNDIEELTAHPEFRILATMNPGGDFGKKELSPAMRNRFTEIWVPAITEREDLTFIIKERFIPPLVTYHVPLLDFMEWFRPLVTKRSLSLRDVLAWISFMNTTTKESEEEGERRKRRGCGLTGAEAYIHGACMVLLDALDSSTPRSLLLSTSSASSSSSAISASQPTQVSKLKRRCLEMLLSQLSKEDIAGLDVDGLLATGMLLTKSQDIEAKEDRMDHDGDAQPRTFGLPNCPFKIDMGIPDEGNTSLDFALLAPTTSKNCMRVLRALQLPKPILLEGSPGVGKTSLVTAIAKASGHHPLVRINLSEQTDMMDLLGSDLPVQGGGGGEFAWCDGVLLKALKRGDWVLLDELNLASQSVLEGLNSILDHRAEMYLPELGRSFHCPPTFRIFACQNPVRQGGGRKGLPKSFLNRFTQVHVDELHSEDLLFITQSLYPHIPSSILQKMIHFNELLFRETMVETKYARKGSPWEFNLRDVFRWCDVMTLRQKPATTELNNSSSLCWDPAQHLDLIYLQRMRTSEDKEHVLRLFNHVFSSSPATSQMQRTIDEPSPAFFTPEKHPYYNITPDYIQVGSSCLPRLCSKQLQTGGESNGYHLLKGSLNVLENMMTIVEKGWMTILIGPPASGKTSTVRLLSELTGNPLKEFCMNSSVDTTELLGGFEQIDLQRHKREVLQQLGDLLQRVSEGLLLRYFVVKTAGGEGKEQQLYLSTLQDLHSTWSVLTARTRFSASPSSSSPSTPSSSASSESLMLHRATSNYDEEQYHLFDQLCVKLQTSIERFCLFTSSQQPEETNSSASALIPTIKQQLRNLREAEQRSVSGCFEWVDGMLIKALENGHWILIDNVNFCPSTVLDRLNPLLENEGVLLVNERGLVDGEIKRIVPHPNFRLFLAMDPQNGEISRAMRNRGIELSLLPPDLSYSFASSSYEEDNNKVINDDAIVLLNGRGIPGSRFPQRMLAFHQTLISAYEGFGVISSSSSTNQHHCLTLRALLQWASLTVEQCRRGVALAESLLNAMELVYVRHLRQHAHQQSVRALYHQHFDAFLQPFSASSYADVAQALNLASDLHDLFARRPQQQQHQMQTLSLFLAPTLWPFFVSGPSYQQDSILTSIRRQGALLQHHLFKEQGTGYDVPRLLAIASLYLLENVSAEDWAHRIHWMNTSCAQYKTSSPASSDFIAALPSVLDQAEQHPLVVMCQRVRTTLQQQLREVHKRSNSNNMSVSFDRLLTFQPIDLEPNAPLVNRLSNTVFFSRDGNEEEEEEEEQRNVLLWRFYENLMQRVPLLLVLLFQQHKERCLLRSLLNQKPSSSSSSHLDNLDVISLSYLFFHQKISATRLPHPSISLLPSFFAELDTILQERMINQEESGVDIAAMEVVLRERLEFWNYLQGIRRAGDFELASYHLRWIALVKSLQKRFPSSSSSSSLSALMTRMSELLETSLGSGSQEEDEERRTKEDPREKAKRTLWRHGPKASLLRSEDMFSLERQLLVALYSFIDNKTMHNLPSSSSLTQEEEKENSSNNKLDLSVVSCRLFSAEESSHPLLGYLDEEFKRLLVEGLATLYWLDGSKDKNDINDNNLKTLATIRGRQSERQPLIRSLQELTGLLFQRMKVFQKRYLAFNAPIMEEVLLENEKSLLSSSLSEQQLHQQVMLLSSSAMTMGRENLAENLWPLSDHVSLREERSVIARVLRLCSLLNRSSYGENDHQLLELRKEAHKVLHLVRAFFEKGLKHTSRPPDDFLPYQQLVWKLEGALEEEEEKDDDNIEKKQQTEITKQEQVIEPALLVHRLKSLQINTLAQEMNLRHNLRLWNNSFNDLSFLKPHHHRNREEDEQLHGVLGVEGKGPSRLFQSVQSLFVFHMFGDWRSSLTIGDHNQRTVQLKRLAAHFCESSLADPRSSDWLSLFYCISQVIDCFKHCFVAEQWNSIVNHLATFEAALISALCDEPITNNTLSQQQGETLHKLLLSCNNQSFEQRVESLLLPCFRLLFWKLSQHQPEENNNVPEQVIELMAQSQLNIFLGLLRMELLLPMQRIDPTAKYAVRLQQLEARCTALDDEVKQRKELEQLFTGKSTNARIEHLLREKQVCLAQMKALKELLVLRPSSSSTSFSALYEDLHRFAQMQGKQSVVLDLMNSFLSALRSVYASSPNTLNCSILHQREQLWQEKAVHFVVHIANEYPYYKDITEPFSVAVQQMMFGLRILRFELGSLMHQNNQHQQKQIKRSRRTAEEEEEEEEEKERAVSQGLLVGYYSRREEKQQQQSVNRLEHLLAQRASGALLRNSLWKLLLHLVSFPFKENVSCSSSPSIFLSPLQHIERGLMDADSLYLLRHDDRQNVFRDLYPQVLRNVMSRLFLHINNTSSSSVLVPKKKTLSKTSFFMLDFVFSEFVAIWERAKQRARKRQEEEAEFFKRKQRETLILTEEEEEEKSLRELFPDYWDIFADLGVTGGDTKDGYDVELDKEARKAEQEEKELRERIEKVRLEEEKRTVADLKDWEVHHICDTHAHIFQFTSSPSSSLVFHQPNKDNKKKNRRRRRKQQRIKEEESEEEQRDRLYEKAHTDLLQTCYQVGLRMLERLDFNVPPELDEQGVGAHLLLMRTLHKALSLPPAAEMKKRQFWLSSSSPTSSSSANKEANNEGELVSFIDTPAGKQGLDYDIYRDANVPEVLLIQAPLEALLKRLQELLEEFPGNALLEQLIKIVRRIMAFPITSPLMKVLTGLELLHGKAYDWETNASKTVSLQQELQQLARLIGRWRRLELQSWPMLLRARTQVHQMKGEKWWFYLYSLLLDFGSEDSAFDFCTGASKDEKQKQKEEGKKRKRRRGGAKEEEEANEVEEKAEEKEDIVAVLDRFLRLSTYGEFVTRLNMMVNFYHHLETELSITSQQDCEEKGQKHAKWEKRSRLSNVFYNIRGYYAQFIDSLASGLQTMREPIEKKMKDFVKLARWDDLSHYALKLAAEKSHRKLNKFTRKMEEVLTASIIPVLEEKSLSIDDIETVRTKRREQRERQKKKEQRRAQRQQLKHKKKERKEKEKEEEGKEKEKEKEEEDEEDTIAFWEYAPDSLRWHSDTFIFNTSPSSFISHERGQRTPELSAIFDLENKGNKLQQLFSRLQKICSRHLFLLPRRRIEDKDEELLAMHHPTTRREQELIELEALCTDLVERTLFLRDQSKAKTKKIHSFRDMLHSLHQVRGLSHLSTAYSPRQKDMNHVLSLPSLHSVDSFFASSSLSQQQNEDESAKWTREHVPSLWKASNELYYKLLRRMQNMRQAMEVPSKELNAKEIARSSGYCEHLFHLVLLQRERIERMTADHADLSMLLSTFASLHRHHQQQQQSSCCLPAQEEAQRWLLLQKNVLDQLEQMLRQLALVLKAIPASSSSFNTDALCRVLKEQADICARCKHRLQRQFDGWKFDVFVALADRLQQQQNEEAGSLECFFDERILVTGECWGVVSQNFASLDALVSSLRQHLKKATEDEEESKRSQLTLPEPVREDALSLLCKVRQLVDAFVEQQRRGEVVSEKEKQGEPPEIIFGKSFSEKASLLVDNILISIQNAKQVQEKMEASSSEEAKEEGIQHFERANLPELNTYFEQLYHSLRPSKLNAQALELLHELARFNRQQQSKAINQMTVELIAHIFPLLCQYQAVMRWWTVRFMTLHHSLCRTLYVLSAMVLTLFTEGYCCPPSSEEGEGEGGEGQMKFEDDVAGTGMGDAQGKKDVSEQIEDEEQLMGTTNEEKEERRDEDKEDEERNEEEGFDMQQDFDGELENVDEKDEEKEKNEEQEEEEEELEREMGELDEDEENVVDEKLWNPSDDEEDEDENQKEEKIEKDSSVDSQGQEDAEKEMAAKEDGEEPESKDKEEKQQKQEDKKKEEEKDQQGNKEEEEEEDEEDEEHGAQDVDDLYEDKHDVDVRKEEEFELPEDMELEGDDGKDDQEGEENEQEEEKEEQEEQDMDSTEQEQMKEEGEEEEEGEDEEGEGEGEENRDHDDKEKDGEDELNDEGDKEATASEGTELKNEEEEEEEEEDDEQHDRLQANPDEKYETEAAEQAQGVMDRTGAESSNITLDPEERKRKEEKEEEEDQQRKGGDDQQKQSKENMMDADESVQQGHDNENEEDAESSWKPVSSRQQKRENEESERQNNSKRQAEPNPYRSVGDAMKRWKERLKVLKEQQMNDEQQEEGNKEEQEGMDVDEDVEAAEEDIHEFVKKGEEKETDKQTLAPTEETLLEDTQIPLRDQDEVKLQDEKEEETQEEQQKKNENKIEEEQEESNTSSALTDQSTKKEKPKDSNEKTKEEEEEMQVEEKKEKEKQEEEERRQQQTPNEEEDIISASSALEELNLDEEERVDEEKLLLSEEEMARQREDLEAFMSKWRNQENASTMVQAGEELWRRLQKVTDHLSVELCEQLRLILEPTLCTQMRGDYRTGKRLNMKKVIPYIASSFKKDKIWLRRTKPSKRHYQVLLAIDDSRSMKENRCDNFALQALTMMANALAQLEVGELSVLAFGEETKLLHPFGKMWSQESGVEAVSQFSFAQEKTNVLSLLETTIRIFHSSKSAFSAAQPNADNLQLAFFISDGRFGSRGREVKKWIREASLRNIFLVFIITDAPSTSASSSAPSSSEMNLEGKRGEEEEEEGAQKGGRRRRRQQHKEHQLQNLGRPDSILEVQTISYIGGKPTRTSYMDTFPFPNYIIIHDINNLPTVLADALRQWFELLQQKFSQ
ncbi:Midasin [Balamuthia mandrillaris]